MMWEAMGLIGEGWAWAESCICKDLEQGVRFSAVVGYCSDGVLPGGVDLLGVDDFFWDTPSLGDGIFFIGLGRILGVGTVYVTSLENFADVLFGVGVFSFNFRSDNFGG